MEDGSGYDTTEYETVEDGSTGYRTDPISSFFGGIFFIIILVLLLIFVVIFMVYRGASWVGSTVTGGTRKEGFEMPISGPQPCAEYDDQWADFPVL